MNNFISFIDKRFAELELRVSALERMEARVSALEKVNSDPSRAKVRAKRDSRGPKNDVLTLIQEGYLNTPRESKEATEELKRLGHYHSLQAVDTAMRRMLGEELTRIKEDNIWKYVVRK